MQRDTNRDDCARLYLDLLKGVLTREITAQPWRPVDPTRRLGRLLHPPLRQALASRGVELVRVVDPQARTEGRTWTADAETMIGRERLDSLERCLFDVLDREVPGDLIETGVWRGGAAIFMRAVLKAYGEHDRIVWAADSFQGLPKPDPARYLADTGDAHWKANELAVPLEQVQANFAKYGLLDEQVRFLVGWFRDTLPTAPIDRLSLLRLDGDMYESTIVALRALYPKLSAGGYVVVDDYGAVPGCRSAVTDFRAEHDITAAIHSIDWTGVYWQRDDDSALSV